jgi:eukaryotic-like serine/threonine-protein kinase
MRQEVSWPAGARSQVSWAQAMGAKLPEPPGTSVPPVAALPSAEDYRSAIGAQNDDSTGKFDISVVPTVDDTGELVPLKPGDVFGRYELIRQLGKGGMGSVFLARDTRLGRRVAIKFLHASDATLGRRFIAEARATAQCSHENIVVIHEAAEAEGRHFMVLEYLQGRSLNEVVPSGETASPERAIELLLPVVKALVCAHAAGIVHRDLKPQNVFVTDSGAVKVLDFGIAAIVGEEGPAEAVETMSGTLSAMSPEQWNTEAIDHRSDLWSVGIMLFRLLSGAHPLAGKRGIELAITADAVAAHRRAKHRTGARGGR